MGLSLFMMWDRSSAFSAAKGGIVSLLLGLRGGAPGSGPTVAAPGRQIAHTTTMSPRTSLPPAAPRVYRPAAIVRKPSHPCFRETSMSHLSWCGAVIFSAAVILAAPPRAASDAAAPDATVRVAGIVLKWLRTD